MCNEQVPIVHMCVYIYVQWNLSITNTLGTEKQCAIKRFPLLRRGCFTSIGIRLDPPKQSVMERFSLLEEFVIRGSLHILTYLLFALPHTGTLTGSCDHGRCSEGEYSLGQPATSIDLNSSLHLRPSSLFCNYGYERRVSAAHCV